jgi:hypothetical protein
MAGVGEWGEGYGELLWTAFIADNGSNDTLVASSDGTSWTPSVVINQTSLFTPSLARLKRRPYVAIITNDVDSATANAAFTVIDNNGKKKNWSLPIGPTGAPIVGAKSSPFTANGQFVFGPSAAAPIISLQLKFAGVNSSAFAPFAADQGAITYTASNVMYVDDNQPPCSASQGGLTRESSNCAYGLLPVGPSKTFVQPFFPQPS